MTNFWKVYNKQLVERAKKLTKTRKLLTIKVNIEWDKEVEELNKEFYTRRGGRKYEFPDSLFVLLYIIKVYEGLSYRQLEGRIYGMFKKTPNFRTIRKRVMLLDYETIEKVNKDIIRHKTDNSKLEIILDATGVRVNNSHVYREKKYKTKRKRNWKKLHLAMDRKTGLIVAHNVMSNNVSEVETRRLLKFLEEILKNIGDNVLVSKLYGDGAYDNTIFFEALREIDIDPVIKIDKITIENIRKQLYMNRFKLGNNGRELWKASTYREKKALEQREWKRYVRKKGYGFRSGIEGWISSFKNKFGEHVMSKSMDMIRKEILFKIMIMNMMR